MAGTASTSAGHTRQLRKDCVSLLRMLHSLPPQLHIAGAAAYATCGPAVAAVCILSGTQQAGTGHRHLAGTVVLHVVQPRAATGAVRHRATQRAV
jgi:hypothetical protein